MRTNWKTLLSTAAVVAALAVGQSVYAYADTPSKESRGMMQGGEGSMMGQGNMGMMNMMQQMGQMMETCNNMMQGMAQHHGPKDPKEDISPDKEG